MSPVLGQVAKFVLSNGLVILVSPMTNVPRVSMELWYHVGSKDERSGERGLAHLIEHMIFKGTDKLSECDINVIVHKAAGYTNAFTSHDATAYVYHFPTQYWKEGFKLLANCMRNARFDEQMLTSELKAVIQELKLYKDRYVNVLVEDMLSFMFPDHPYHYPIIGFKQDLWNLDRQTLLDFYHHHYVPNNAFLVVSGDVTPEEVFEYAQETFGALKADPNYKREEYYYGRDLVSKSITLRRDVQQPIVMIATVLPGAKTKKQYVFDLLALVLGAGKSSRLVKKLVDELELVTDLQAFVYDMEDACPFFIYFEPKEESDIEKIKTIIHEEIALMVKEGIAQEELDCADRQLKMSVLNRLEQSEKRVTSIGQGFLFTGDENYIFNYANYVSDDLEGELKELLANYFTPSMMHTGTILPLLPGDKEQWKLLQELSDAEDKKILHGRVRNTPVEAPCEALKLQTQTPKAFHFPRPEKYALSNGLKVFVRNTTDIPKIDIALTLKSRSDADPEDMQGLYAFMCEMLLEGTKNYPGTTLAQKIESYGMSLSIDPGIIKMSMLSQDFPQGLALLHELLTQATFEKEPLEKIRDQFLNELKFFWDDPRMFGDQITREAIYKKHPYAKNSHGTFESLAEIDRKHLKEFYKTHITPHGARIAIVGDLGKYDVRAELQKTLGAWKGPEVQDFEYPVVEQSDPELINYQINRDQVTLIFARPSITRLDKDFDALLLFDQIFAGESMSSRLFHLREQSGLFYGISGGCAAHADEQPGFFVVKTVVSLDRLEEAETRIKQLIDTVVDSLTQTDLEDAKRVVINAQVNQFATNKRMALTFLAIDRFGFPDDYFDTREQRIAAITLDEVKRAARRFLESKALTTIKIGRVED